MQRRIKNVVLYFRQQRKGGTYMISKILSNPMYEPQYKFKRSNGPFLDMIDEFKDELVDDKIWLSVDESELPEIQNNKTILDIIELALQLAKKLCVDSTLQQDRFIRVRTRNLQNKTFIRIQYSTSKNRSVNYDTLAKNIERKVEYAGGYFRHHYEEDVGNIKIALPIS